MNESIVIYFLRLASGEFAFPDTDGELMPFDNDTDSYPRGIYINSEPTLEQLDTLHRTADKRNATLLRVEQYVKVEKPHRLGEIVTVTGKVVAIGAHEVTVEFP